MLYQSIYVEAGSDPLPRTIVQQPSLAAYVRGWGRSGDLGVIASDGQGSQPIGAVWSRLASEAEHGFGYVDAQTPELGIAVLPEYRGQGVGTALLRRYLAEAERLYPAVSLSVSPNNPAKRLYERLGFKQVTVRTGHPVMLRRFDP